MCAHRPSSRKTTCPAPRIGRCSTTRSAASSARSTRRTRWRPGALARPWWPATSPGCWTNAPAAGPRPGGRWSTAGAAGSGRCRCTGFSARSASARASWSAATRPTAAACATISPRCRPSSAGRCCAAAPAAARHGCCRPSRAKAPRCWTWRPSPPTAARCSAPCPTWPSPCRNPSTARSGPGCGSCRRHGRCMSRARAARSAASRCPRPCSRRCAANAAAASGWTCPMQRGSSCCCRTMATSPPTPSASAPRWTAWSSCAAVPAWRPGRPRPARATGPACSRR
mmetsp:Transcript_38713/g.90643  ORF Transcript_38713/g.90643 Transcript_38713/m.90643 type:complete len:284 (-) Transcript_38713:1034-1885(-)